ncbi:hypothetical protein AKJ09_10367 [Labilithrix luteola]|uniref:FUSC family protein n=1 Tax=Labilithrix luteola TaxID=1391654 RepID=A0A0K1QD81_9BACT|nr:FUSC family protein [Labilithrix luteola]AKV03704.1 hypothetical protein AKJ09_10367 [Labilithrix luteola]
MNRSRLALVVFSAKSFAAALLAFAIAARLDLPNPYWALVTVYVVSQPLYGMIRSTGTYRVIGTVLGAVATWVLVPNLVNAPELLSLAMALWVSGCLFVSLLDRTPRGYAFVLAGYTAAIIGFPSVTHPESLFDTSIARVEEITLGVVTSTVVHGLFARGAVHTVIVSRIDAFLRDAERWVLDTLEGRRGSAAEKDQQRLAADVTQLGVLAAHLPFEAPQAREITRTIAAIQNRMSALLPLASAMEDRLVALASIESENTDERRERMVALATWVRKPNSSYREAVVLARSCQDLAERRAETGTWEGMLDASLFVRAAEFVYAWQDCRDLRVHLRTPGTQLARRLAPLLDDSLARAVHRDAGQAIVSASAAGLAVLGISVTWITTAWPEGAGAALTAALYACAYAARPDPVPSLQTALAATVLAFVFVAVYTFIILPSIDGLPMLAMVLAPTYLVAGALAGQPRWARWAGPFLMNLNATLALQGTLRADVGSFVNSVISQVVGFLGAIVATSIVRGAGSSFTVTRVMRAGFRELARLGERPQSRAVYTAKMIDRVGLLVTAGAFSDESDELARRSALLDLRIGLNVIDLLGSELATEKAAKNAIDRLVEALGKYFAGLAKGRQAAPPDQLLERIDGAIGEAVHPESKPKIPLALVALVGLRRALFPDAAAYAEAKA